MVLKDFYISYKLSTGDILVIKLQGRKDIVNVIDNGLTVDKDPIAYNLADDLMKIQSLLLGLEPKQGSLYIPPDDEFMN